MKNENVNTTRGILNNNFNDCMESVGIISWYEWMNDELQQNENEFTFEYNLPIIQVFIEKKKKFQGC